MIINSYSENFLWSNDIIEQVSKNIFNLNKRSDVDFEKINIEHINSFVITDKEVRDFEVELGAKYQKSPSLVVLIGDPACCIILSEFYHKWADTRFICIKDSYRNLSECGRSKNQFVQTGNTSLLKSKRVDVIYTPLEIKRTVEDMKRLIPRLNTIVYITDKRLISQYYLRELKKTVELQNHAIRFLYFISDVNNERNLINEIKAPNDNIGILYDSWLKKRGED